MTLFLSNTIRMLINEDNFLNMSHTNRNAGFTMAFFLLDAVDDLRSWWLIFFVLVSSVKIFIIIIIIIE